MALFKCPGCGNMISDRAFSCPKCNYSLRKEETAEAVKGNVQSETLNPATRPVPMGFAENKGPNVPAKKKSKKIWLIVGIAALLITAVILVVIFGFSKGQKKETEAKQSEAASRVVGKIDAIGSVTLNSKGTIDEIEKAYQNLTEEEKAQVTNLDKLKNAKSKLTMLENEKASKEKAEQEEKERKEQKAQKERELYNTIKTKVDDIEKLSNSITYGITNCNDAGSVYSAIKDHQNENKRAYTLLSEVYELSSGLPNNSKFRADINKAKNALPLDVSGYDTASLNRYLDQLEDFLRSWADALIDFADITRNMK